MIDLYSWGDITFLAGKYILLFRIWCCFVIELSIIIKSVVVTFISNQTCIFLVIKYWRKLRRVKLWYKNQEIFFPVWVNENSSVLCRASAYLIHCNMGLFILRVFFSFLVYSTVMDVCDFVYKRSCRYFKINKKRWESLSPYSLSLFLSHFQTTYDELTRQD